VPAETVIWDLVERTGWTLEYIDSLPIQKLHDWLRIDDGKGKAHQSMRKRKHG